MKRCAQRFQALPVDVGAKLVEDRPGRLAPLRPGGLRRQLGHVADPDVALVEEVPTEQLHREPVEKLTVIDAYAPAQLGEIHTYLHHRRRQPSDVRWSGRRTSAATPGL